MFECVIPLEDDQAFPEEDRYKCYDGKQSQRMRALKIEVLKQTVRLRPMEWPYVSYNMPMYLEISNEPDRLRKFGELLIELANEREGELEALRNEVND